MIPVAIVGAGPVGLTAALLLARHGVPSVVLERHPQPFPLPRAVHLDDEVCRILQAAGVAEAFRRVSRPTLGMRLLDARHRTMAEFRRARPIGDHGYPQANLFDQPDLERLLREAVAGAGIPLRTGAEVLGVHQEAGLVRLRVRGREDLTARAVLGCDGANSTVRASIGATLTDLGFSEQWCVIDARSATPLDAWDGVHQVCDPARAATYMRVGPDRYRWEFRVRPGEDVAALTEPDRLAELLRPWTGGAPVEVIRAQAYTFKARLADRWRRGRVFLLGDAAHLTPPFIGQGLGSGVRDALNLSWKLAAVLRHAADERLLDTYATERAPHARRMVRTAMMVGWTMTGGQDGAAALRRAVLAGACRLPGFTASALDAAAPRLRRGPLVRSRPGPRPGLAGTLVPQPWVTVDGHPQRFDDVLGTGFALLSAGPLDDTADALAASIGARRLVLGRDLADDDGTLRAWLARGRARYALIRPDRVVLAADRTGQGLLDAVRASLPLLPPFRMLLEGAA
ncbi:bifunctional 3-(3-hydroxy-phenyl)propionate/3-hydroxycinnamic acid hydroxylase [Cryptosporangium minutisporangium]|uniref:Bifunctional 3-(3-hydroxy-phenyl)propionate/3-hydroxycinnamic acid hydroxylase n=1 Tax=Cryptosporangium minutisporangium TaxID=113569 RepID=A0ABP6T0M4_9ACTN